MSDSFGLDEEATSWSNNGRNRGRLNVLVCIVHDIKLVTTVIHDLWDYRVAPQPVDGQGKLFGKAKVGINRGGVQFVV